MPQNGHNTNGGRNLAQNGPVSGQNLPPQIGQNQHQQTQTMMSQQNYAEQLNCRMVQQSQNRNCNEILAAKPQTK